jgi:Nucleotidyl transferase AbiEii toxin, Type IV TA system
MTQLKFLQLPPEERALYFGQAAERRGLSPVVMEKDFWVCWMLGVLFDSEFRDVIVFKGGTSLSKVFGAIARFSEDIDLSLSPAFVGLPDPDTASRTQGNKWMKAAEAACVPVVEGRLKPELERVVAGALGSRDGPWLEFDIDTVTESPVILFHYPTTQPSGFDYLKRSVKLEFGSLTDQHPTVRRAVRPWLADEIPEALEDWHCMVVALGVERTFWEKATILHAEYHRPLEIPTPSRFSRHYADLAALAKQPFASGATNDDALRERVVNWKSQFFGSAWARYDLARPGTFRLVPPGVRISALRADYQAMRDMYLTEPEDFDTVMAILQKLEQQINRDVGA